MLGIKIKMLIEKTGAGESEAMVLEFDGIGDLD
jgi:hypothetical protein